MPGEVFKCVGCINMAGVEEGEIPKDFIEYDFAEDALDFEVRIHINQVPLQIHEYYLLVLTLHTIKIFIILLSSMDMSLSILFFFFIIINYPAFIMFTDKSNSYQSILFHDKHVPFKKYIKFILRIVL